MLQLAALTLVLGCEAERPAAGASQAPAARVDGARICLELQAPRERVMLGEPLTLVASLVNCSPAVQQVDDLLSPEFGFLQVWIQPPDGKELLYRPMTYRDNRGKPKRSLAPGERISAFASVYADPDGWTIAQPGRYRFRAQYSVEATRLEAKPVHVFVAPPQNGADREAATIIMSREVARLLAVGRDEKGEAFRRLTAIARQYPQSRLAPYARIALAVAESRDRFDPSTKAFAKGNCEGPVEQLARAVAEVADPSIAAMGTTAWIRCLRQLGRDKEVNGAISTFLRSHPAARDVTAVAQTLRTARQE